MTSIDKLLEELKPDEIENRFLGEISSIYDGTHQTPRYTDQGVKFISVENIRNIYSSNKFISKDDYIKLYKIKPQINDVFMTRIGTIGTCAVVDKNEQLAYYVTLTLIRPNQDIVNSKFIKYYIESTSGQRELRKRTLINAVPIKINLGDIGKIPIPIPPLPIQQEIVNILDKFTQLEAELEAELEARKVQYEYYRNELLSFNDENIEWRSLGGKDGIAEIGTGNRNTIDADKNGLYDFYVRSPEILKLGYYDFDEEAIITSGDGVGVGKILHYVNGKYALHQRAYRFRIREKNIRAKYVFWYLKKNFLKYIIGNAVNSSVSSLRRPVLEKMIIAIPSLKEQDRIIAFLDKFDLLINNLSSGLPAEIKARRKQYEFYREKLLTFKPLADG